MERRHERLYAATANMLAVDRFWIGDPDNQFSDKDLDSLNDLTESVNSMYTAAVRTADADNPLREVGFNLLIAKAKRSAERSTYEANNLIAELNGVTRDHANYQGVALADAAVDEAMAAVARAFEVCPE